MGRLRLALLAVAACSASAPASAQPGSDRSLHTFLQAYFADRLADDGDARYSSARADLNADGRQEALVLMQARSLCGTGGCTMLVLTPGRGDSWRVVTRLAVTYAPVRLLRTRSRDWHDLAVRVAGGGIPAREVRLRFDGRSYPRNPSVVTAGRRNQPGPGRVLISQEDAGRLLYR